jgi:hypothetical protein
MKQGSPYGERRNNKTVSGICLKKEKIFLPFYINDLSKSILIPNKIIEWFYKNKERNE